MKILIFNWRDIKHPKAGGAEIYFHEMAKRWVKKGSDITWISGGWKGCKKRENIDGIKIIRVGNAFLLYFLAPFAYINLKEKPDIIIDVENGIPFFTPVFSNARKILHIHHIHKEIWFKEMPLLLALIGWLLEMKIIPIVYKNAEIITVSKSSADEIKKEFKRNSRIVNPGIDFVKYKKFEKNTKPAILFLNRIKKYKGIKILLDAVKELKKENIDFDVWIAGSGSEMEKMKKYALKNKLSNVQFFGKISEEKKKELMQKAWIFVNPSFKEGWGIVNIEANYFGTPVIGSDVCGIKDSIANGKTGLLFEHGNYRQLAEKIKLLIRNNKLRNRLSKNAVKWAKNFGWKKSANEYMNILKKLLNKNET